MSPSIPPARSGAGTLDITLDDQPRLDQPADTAPHPRWLWVLVRRSTDPVEEVWVRYAAEAAPAGLEVRAAAQPKPGSVGVAIVSVPGTLGPLPETATKRQYRARRPRVAPTDRNLVTVAEFAALIPCSQGSVHDLIKLGLPSIKSPAVGRRVLKEQALAWLINGVARKSRVALKLAKAARAKNTSPTGAPDGTR